jgi:hypothetical protein
MVRSTDEDRDDVQRGDLEGLARTRRGTDTSGGSKSEGVSRTILRPVCGRAAEQEGQTVMMKTR